jgi:hypothetical protein
MNTIGVLLLVAASAAGQELSGGTAHVGGLRLFRHSAVRSGPPPANGMAVSGSACSFGHAGCQGGPACPGAAGAAGMAGQPGRRFPNVRSQVFFVDPPGMKIGWQTRSTGPEKVYLPAQLSVPARYNFMQGYIYRLKLTEIPGRPGLNLYPSIEVAPSTPATDAYLTHNPIPAQFTEEDFDQVQAGNFVTKVIYLPDPKYQELASNVETLISTRLDPGVDPILEADRRGTILMIVRLGGIDEEMPAGGATVPAGPGAMTGPVTGGALPPGSLPGGAPFAPRGPETVPLDNAPVSPAPGAAPTPPPPAPTTPPTPPPPAPGDTPAPAPDAKPGAPGEATQVSAPVVDGPKL